MYTNKKEFQETMTSEKSKLKNNICSETCKNTQNHTIHACTVMQSFTYVKEGLEEYTPY